MDVPSWRIEAPVPAPGSAYPNETVWDRLAHKLVAQGGHGKLTPVLHCAATETARFYAVNGAYPDDGTRRYFAERCGSTLPSLGLGTVTGEAPATVPDAEIAKQYEATLEKTVAALDGVTEVGVGVSRHGSRVGVAVMYGRPVARFSDFSPLATGESVMLAGRLSVDAAFALGLVNQGEHGVVPCEPDRSVKLPRFRMTCPLSADDQVARVEITTRRRGRVLMELELQALVRKDDEAGLVYEPVTRGTRTVAATAAKFQSALFTDLNEARRAAGLPALSLEKKQSEVNRKLAPHLYGASHGGDDDTADQIGLGVLAGWDVSGLIRDGGIFWGSVTSTRGSGRFLSYTLESPLARYILLDPTMTTVAIGAEALGTAGAMALVTTYAFFGSSDHSTDEDKVFTELDKQRRAKKHSAPKRAKREGGMDRALAEISSGKAGTSDALSHAMDHVSQTQRRSVVGWVIETADLKQITWPDALVEREPLEVEIGVTHYKAPGGAWGQYVVLVLFYESG
jgi:hypothetical protein